MLPSIPGALDGHAHPWVYKPVLKNLVNLTEITDECHLVKELFNNAILVFLIL
jgi:hypothetical protein